MTFLDRLAEAGDVATEGPWQPLPTDGIKVYFDSDYEDDRANYAFCQLARNTWGPRVAIAQAAEHVLANGQLGKQLHRRIKEALARLREVVAGQA